MGAHSRTSESTASERVGVTPSATRFSINGKHAWYGIGERRAYLNCSRSERLQAQAQSHSNASVARWLESTSRTSASWPALCAAITPALGPELGASHVDHLEPSPEVHAMRAGRVRQVVFFPHGGPYIILPIRYRRDRRDLHHAAYLSAV